MSAWKSFPSSKINRLTWHFLLSPLSPLRVLPADFNPRGYGLAEPEKLGFLWRGDYKASCKKCLGWVGMNQAGQGLRGPLAQFLLPTRVRTRESQVRHPGNKV